MHGQMDAGQARIRRIGFTVVQQHTAHALCFFWGRYRAGLVPLGLLHLQPKQVLLSIVIVIAPFFQVVWPCSASYPKLTRDDVTSAS